MDTQNMYMNALLSEAAYADFIIAINPDGAYRKEDVKTALRDTDFSASQADYFVNHWQVVSHQPDTDSGFSATLFKSTDPNAAQPYVLGIRGTAGNKDLFVADGSDIALDGLAIDQVLDMWNYWGRLTTAKGDSFIGLKLE